MDDGVCFSHGMSLIDVLLILVTTHDVQGIDYKSLNKLETDNHSTLH